MKHEKAKCAALWLGLSLALASGGCNRAQVNDDVRDLKRTGDDVEAHVRDGVETAKQGAEKVKQELPAATQRAHDEIVAVGREVKSTLDTASDKVRRETAPVRDALHDDKKE
jgi:ABC-type Zn2+ transport system substrate-binding protein/surface adhesin